MHAGSKRVRIIPFTQWVHRLGRLFGVGKSKEAALVESSNKLGMIVPTQNMLATSDLVVTEQEVRMVQAGW